MSRSNNQTSEQFPMIWRHFLTLLAICKAAIAGGGLTLAALGGLDIAFAITAQTWWDGFSLDMYINQAALFGSLSGAGIHVAVLSYQLIVEQS